jgi:hypothetical protein
MKSLILKTPLFNIHSKLIPLPKLKLILISFRLILNYLSPDILDTNSSKRIQDQILFKISKENGWKNINVFSFILYIIIAFPEPTVFEVSQEEKLMTQ